MMTALRCAVALALLAGVPCQAQNAMPAVDADVRSRDAIIHAFYDVISGPAGPRDWDRFYSLFAPGATLTQTSRAAPDSTPRVVVQTPQEFAADVQPYFANNAFDEHAISHSSIDTFGAITHVFGAKEAKHAPTDAKPFGRGIYSAQLFNDGMRWYIVTMYWDNEYPGNPTPARYLK